MSLKDFFAPKSIAVVGASREPHKVGHLVVTNLQQAGYEGEIIPVNPHVDEEIAGLPVVPSVASMQHIPDLVVMAIPVAQILKEFKACCDAGCKQFVILTAGFKESGEKGAKIEQKLIEIATHYDVTLLGPNCLGFVHSATNVNATFAEVDLQPGSAHIISQSGAIASAFFDRSTSANLGFADCVTLGNKATLSENELLAHRAEQDDQGPIGLYLEEITDGRKFLQLTQKISKKQPVFLLKPGKSAAAAAAMQSHTGSIAGEDEVVQAACDQAGIMRCHTIEDLFDGLLYFSWQPAPQGNRLAVISNAGGPGVIAADQAEEFGLQLAKLSDETQQTLQEALPREATVKNPVDLMGDAQADRYRSALTAVIDDAADVDMILVVLTPQEMTQIEETAKVIAELAEQHDMPVVCAFIGQHHIQAGHDQLHQHQIPCFGYPHRALRILSQAYRREQFTQRQDEDSRTISPSAAIKTTFDDLLPAAGAVQDTLLEEMLNTAGVKTPKSITLSTRKEGLKRAEQIGYPVVMKLSSPDLLHKFEHDGVIANISSPEQLKEAYKTLNATKKKLKSDGFTHLQIRLQQQITQGVELLVGYKHDPTFGKVILFGPGGTLTELFHDHEMLVLPATHAMIEQLLSDSSISPLLDGFRGRPPVNKKALVDFLEKFIRIVETVEHIDQFEVNPLIVNTCGAYAVDPKMILTEQ